MGVGFGAPLTGCHNAGTLGGAQSVWEVWAWMHLYSTPWNITSEPTEYAVFGAQVGMVCAKAAHGSAKQRMIPAARTSGDFIFIDDLL